MTVRQERDSTIDTRQNDQKQRMLKTTMRTLLVTGRTRRLQCSFLFYFGDRI